MNFPTAYDLLNKKDNTCTAPKGMAVCPKHQTQLVQRGRYEYYCPSPGCEFVTTFWPKYTKLGLKEGKK